MNTRPIDRFDYCEKQYFLAGISGDILFNPCLYGLKLTPPNSACWHGYQAWYQVRGGALRMKSLKVWSEEVETLPLLLYGAPFHLREGEDVGALFADFDGAYEDCPEPVPFTGGLLLGRGFVPEYALIRRPSPVLKFRRLHELIFSRGRLVKAQDCSHQIAELRRRQVDLCPKPLSGKEIVDKFEATFCLRYDIWKGP